MTDQRILGIDYGTKRIGLAISDLSGSIAQSFKTITREDGSSIESVTEQIKSIVVEYKISSIVVGIPMNLNGTRGRLVDEIMVFIDKLKKEINVLIEQWNEWLTTVEAERVMIEQNVSRKKRRQHIDKVSAVLILQNYLDSKRK